jgi:hypothetical protein
MSQTILHIRERAARLVYALLCGDQPDFLIVILLPFSPFVLFQCYPNPLVTRLLHVVVIVDDVIGSASSLA